MSRADAITAFANRLKTIPRVGNVWSDIANPVSEVDKKARFLVDGRYRAWEVTCEGSQGADKEAAATARTYIVVAYGYFSFQSGSTEADVQALCAAVEAEFDQMDKRTFDGRFDSSEPIQVDGPKLVPYAGIVVHGVIVTCLITEYPIY